MTEQEIKTRIAESASNYIKYQKKMTKAKGTLEKFQEEIKSLILDICEEAYQQGYKQAEKDLEANRIETTINLDAILEKIYNTVTHFMDCKVSFPSEDEKKWDYYFLKKQIYGLYGKDKDITPPNKE